MCGVWNGGEILLSFRGRPKAGTRNLLSASRGTTSVLHRVAQRRRCVSELRKAREDRAADAIGIQSSFGQQFFPASVSQKCIGKAEVQDRNLDAVFRKRLRDGGTRA